MAYTGEGYLLVLADNYSYPATSEDMARAFQNYGSLGIISESAGTFGGQDFMFLPYQAGIRLALYNDNVIFVPDIVNRYVNTTIGARKNGTIYSMYGAPSTSSTNINGIRYYYGSLSLEFSVDIPVYTGDLTDVVDALFDASPPSVSVPITYYPTGCVLQGPSEAEQGDTVNVLVTPGPGKVIKPESIQVYNRSGLITHTYSSGILSFDVPE